MRIGKISVAVIGLVPFNVYGECTPAPDCGSIGYTETSCEGDYLACPFDSTKLKCIPCDSSFRYACDGENVKSTIGSACGDKYVSCECIDGAIFSNGNCVCDTSCKVGAIYYSDGTCSSCVSSNKTAIGVVVKDRELIVSLEIPNQTWSTADEDIADLPNLTENTEALNDFNGKSNTQIIVDYYGENADISKIAGLYCYKYTTEGTTEGMWYLPAGGELYNYIFLNYNIIKSMWSKAGATISNYALWSSTEKNYFYTMAMNSDGSFIGRPKHYYNQSVVCFLEI